MEYIGYNTGTRALPDMYALALGRCAPSGIVHIYQAKHSCLCYNYYIYHFAWEDQRELQGNIRYIALSRGQYSDIAREGGFQQSFEQLFDTKLS